VILFPHLRKTDERIRVKKTSQILGGLFIVINGLARAASRVFINPGVGEDGHELSGGIQIYTSEFRRDPW
jgi:hypothetical protein